MSKRFFLLALIIALSLCTVGCVAPYYGTARIEPGWDFNAGVSYATGPDQITETDHVHWGIRLDGYAGYGFNPYVKPYLRCAFGIYHVVSYPFPGDVDDTISRYFDPGVDIGAGVQAALPLGFVTPALNVEVSPYGVCEVSTALLVGLGKREILTLGVRPHFTPASFDYGYLPIDVFCSVHPIKGLSLFAGVEVGSRLEHGFWDAPWFTIGAGYGFNIKKRSASQKGK